MSRKKQTISCGYCGKQVRIETSFEVLQDLAHVIEIAAEMEKRGWKYNIILTGRNSVIRLSALCEICQVGRS